MTSLPTISSHDDSPTSVVPPTIVGRFDHSIVDIVEPDIDPTWSVFPISFDWESLLFRWYHSWYLLLLTWTDRWYRWSVMENFSLLKHCWWPRGDDWHSIVGYSVTLPFVYSIREMIFWPIVTSFIDRRWACWYHSFICCCWPWFSDPFVILDVPFDGRFVRFGRDRFIHLTPLHSGDSSWWRILIVLMIWRRCSRYFDPSLLPFGDFIRFWRVTTEATVPLEHLHSLFPLLTIVKFVDILLSLTSWSLTWPIPFRSPFDRHSLSVLRCPFPHSRYCYSVVVVVTPLFDPIQTNLLLILDRSPMKAPFHSLTDHWWPFVVTFDVVRWKPFTNLTDRGCWSGAHRWAGDRYLFGHPGIGDPASIQWLIFYSISVDWPVVTDNSNLLVSVIPSNARRDCWLSVLLLVIFDGRQFGNDICCYRRWSTRWYIIHSVWQWCPHSRKFQPDSLVIQACSFRIPTTTRRASERRYMVEVFVENPDSLLDVVIRWLSHDRFLPRYDRRYGDWPTFILSHSDIGDLTLTWRLSTPPKPSDVMMPRTSTFDYLTFIDSFIYSIPMTPVVVDRFVVDDVVDIRRYGDIWWWWPIWSIPLTPMTDLLIPTIWPDIPCYNPIVTGIDIVIHSIIIVDRLTHSHWWEGRIWPRPRWWRYWWSRYSIHCWYWRWCDDGIRDWLRVFDHCYSFIDPMIDDSFDDLFIVINPRCYCWYCWPIVDVDPSVLLIQSHYCCCSIWPTLYCPIVVIEIVFVGIYVVDLSFVLLLKCYCYWYCCYDDIHCCCWSLTLLLLMTRPVHSRYDRRFWPIPGPVILLTLLLIHSWFSRPVTIPFVLRCWRSGGLSRFVGHLRPIRWPCWPFDLSFWHWWAWPPPFWYDFPRWWLDKLTVPFDSLTMTRAISFDSQVTFIYIRWHWAPMIGRHSTCCSFVIWWFPLMMLMLTSDYGDVVIDD